jgi:putative hydrolase of the HAD superfamily
MAVTNGQRTQQRAKMERAGLIADIPDMVTPEDAGAWKPDPGIFHHALARLGVSPSEALMIGDDHECDIVGAQNVGLKTFWVRRGINDLSGALAMLSD